MEKFQEMNIRKNWKSWNILTSRTGEVVSCYGQDTTTTGLCTLILAMILVMKMTPFEKEIRRMKEVIEYVEREFRREIVHIMPLD